MTLKQDQEHQAYIDNEDLEQGYYHVEFERSHFDVVLKSAKVKVFFK